MDAIILAAGYATRLQPYTTHFPKPLLRVRGEALLNHTVRPMLATGRINRVIVVTNARYLRHFEVWRSAFCHQQGIAQETIHILSDGTSTNEDRLGSIGDLAFAVREAGVSGDVLVTCADKLFSFSLADLLSAFAERGTITNVCCDTGAIDKVRNRFGCVELDANGQILSFEEKPAQPRSSYQSIAFYVYSQAVLDLLPEYLASESPDAPGNLLRWLLARMPAQAFEADVTSCADVGNPQSYEALIDAHIVLLDGRSATVAEIDAKLAGLGERPDCALILLQVADPAAWQARVNANPGPVPVNAIATDAEVASVCGERITL